MSDVIYTLFHNDIAATLAFTLLIVSAVLMFLVLKNGAESDAVSRTFQEIDRYIPGIVAAAAIPHVWIGVCLIHAGYFALYAINMLFIVYIWLLSKKRLWGGADAICLMLIGFIMPYTIPLCLCMISSTIITKQQIKHHPEWDPERVPLLIPMKYGYLISAPISILFIVLLLFI